MALLSTAPSNVLLSMCFIVLVSTIRWIPALSFTVTLYPSQLCLRPQGNPRLSTIRRQQQVRAVQDETVHENEKTIEALELKQTGAKDLNGYASQKARIVHHQKADSDSDSHINGISEINTEAAQDLNSELPDILQKIPPQTLSLILLNFVAVIWGTQHAVIKTVVVDTSEGVGAASFTLARFLMAAVLAAPFTPPILEPLQSWWSHVSKPWKQQSGGGGEEEMALQALLEPNGGSVTHGEKNTPQTQNATQMFEAQESKDVSSNLVAEKSSESTSSAAAISWRYGLEMGTWMFLGYALQAVGLQFTTASKSGFLLYLNVKFVPFLAFVTLGRKIAIQTWLSAVGAFMGTGLLLLASSSASGSSDVLTEATSWNVGDVWSMAAALASACFILRLETASEKVKDGAALNSASLWTVTLWSTLWTLGQTAINLAGEGAVSGGILTTAWRNLVQVYTTHPLPLFYLGAVTTALANYLQTLAQRGIRAERASIIYAMDPVYGAAFSYLILGETLGGWMGYLGAGFIVLAAVGNGLFDWNEENVASEEEEA